MPSWVGTEWAHRVGVRIGSNPTASIRMPSSNSTASIRLPSWVGTEWAHRVGVRIGSNPTASIRMTSWVGVRIGSNAEIWRDANCIGYTVITRLWRDVKIRDYIWWVGTQITRGDGETSEVRGFGDREFEVRRFGDREAWSAKIRWSRGLRIKYIMYSSAKVRRFKLNKYVQYVQRYCRADGAAGEHSAQAACGRREVQCCSGEDVACWRLYSCAHGEHRQP